jgi:hypothetical protein
LKVRLPSGSRYWWCCIYFLYIGFFFEISMWS